MLMCNGPNGAVGADKPWPITYVGSNPKCLRIPLIRLRVTARYFSTGITRSAYPPPGRRVYVGTRAREGAPIHEANK